MMSQLIVSVRSATEAETAICGGADIVDIKEPSRGSLGMADPETILEISYLSAGRISVSVALGEWAEWAAPKALPQNDYIHFYKIGFSESPLSERLQSQLRKWPQQRGLLPNKLIAAAYVDWQRAKCPPPEMLLDLAISSGWRGLLLDTWRKDGTWLGDWISIVQLERLVQTCCQNSMHCALAGNLDDQRLSNLLPLNADFYAVRGAACRAGDRNGVVCPSAVRHLSSITRAQSLSNALK